MATEQQQDLTGIAQGVITGFNKGDWEQFRASLAPDVHYEEMGTMRQTDSADAYVQLVQGWKQSFPDAKGTIHHTIASGDKVAQEVLWEGTHTGDMPTPNGTLPASGKKISVPATVWYIFQGNTIKEVHHHIDIMTMMTQLGALPS